MTAHASPGNLAAQRVAERMQADGPWEVFAEEARRYEVHLRGTEVELVRGPVSVQGYGLRLFRARNGTLGVGGQSSTDFSLEGIRSVVAEAEAIASQSEFPAQSVELPSHAASHPDVAVSEPALWDRPEETVESYLAALRSSFSHRKGVEVSFGSVKTTRLTSSLVNSAGFHGSFSHTLVQVELAIKSFGGPEGAPPGEYWVDSTSRRLDASGLPAKIDAWCQFASDARRASAPPSGELPVVLPTGVLSGILPNVLGFRSTGAARLRKLALEPGARLGAETLTVVDDGTYPWSPTSGPFDAEGTNSRKTPLLEHGVVHGLLYDSVNGAAFGEKSTGNAVRTGFGPRPWLAFTHGTGVGSTTMVVQGGPGGTDQELCEAAGDGIWVQQLGWANPDPVSGAFGGEIRIGYRIRHGKLAEPVRGGIVGGTVVAPPKAPSLLANVAAIGSRVDLEESLASPALLIRPLTVAGAAASPK